MTLFLKLLLWPAAVLFLTATVLCIHAILTRELTQAQLDRCLDKFLLWIGLSAISIAGLIALYFS